MEAKFMTPNGEAKPASLTVRLPKIRRKKFFMSFGLIAVLSLILWNAPAQAMTFKQAARKGNATIAQLDKLKTFIGKPGLRELAKLKLSNIKAIGNMLTANVKFNNMNWTFIASSGGAINNTFVGFKPKRIFKFKDLFAKIKGPKLLRGLNLLDVMSFDNQILLAAAVDIKLKSSDLAANAKKILGRFYENPNKFTFIITQGVSMFGTLDMAKSKPIAKAMKFLGGKSTKLQLKGNLSPNLLKSLLKKKAPQPSLHLEAAMPTFRPKIGGLIKLPADIQFTYKADLSRNSVAIGFAGKTKFKIGKQKMNVVLADTLKAKAGEPPSMAVKITLDKGLPWKKAFGVKWLTIKDYQMAFEVNTAGKLSIGLDGTTSFGEKAVGLGGSIQIQAASLGLPLPQSIRFEINDGPNKVGSLALSDMAAVFNEMAKAAGSKVRIPLDKIPDVAIAGVAKGEGPKIKLSLKVPGNTIIDMAGKLRILGEDIATVDKAFIQTKRGIEIKARTAKLKAGPIKFPNADIDVLLRINGGKGTIPTPHVLFSSEGLSLFGSKSKLDMAMFLTNSTMKTTQNFGDLFKFDFSAFAGIKGLNKFADLAKADYRIKASLQSDPGKWIASSGANAVKKALDGLTPGLNKAVRDLQKAKEKVKGLSKEIKKERAIVKKEKQPSVNRLKNAEARVNTLQRTINSLNGQIGTFRGRIKSCNQTKSVCYKWKLSGGSCKKKKKTIFGDVCYKWYPIKSTCSARKSIADLPARAVCTANNVRPVAELATARTKRAGVIAAKVTAGETVKALRKGLQALPVDLDPRVAGLIVAKATATAALEAAKQAAMGLGNFKKIFARAVASVRDPKVFSLQKSFIQGSLNEAFRGRPVVLDMKYRLLGKSYENLMGFSFTDKKFNAKQFEVIALGAATKTVIKLGEKAKIIPHGLLNKVSALYFKRQAEVDAVLQAAIKANGGVTYNNPDDAKLGVGRSIEASNQTRRTELAAKRKQEAAARKKVRDIISKNRREQLARLLAKRASSKGAGWTKMPGKALDIGVNAKGQVWVVGTDHAAYLWSGRDGWTVTFNAFGFKFRKFGRIRRIDVGPGGGPWAIGSRYRVWRPGGWNNGGSPPGGATDIGIGANGSVWIISGRQEAGGYSIFRLVNGGGMGWDKIAGSAVRIDVDPKGNAWVVNKNNDIYRFVGNRWKKMPGKAIDISIGADGTVMVVGTDKKPYVWDGRTWKVLPGSNLLNLSVRRKGLFWATTTDKSILAYGRKRR